MPSFPLALPPRKSGGGVGGEALARGGERVDHLQRVDKRGPTWPEKVTPANPQTGNMSAAT